MNIAGIGRKCDSTGSNPTIMRAQLSNRIYGQSPPHTQTTNSTHTETDLTVDGSSACCSCTHLSVRPSNTSERSTSKCNADTEPKLRSVTIEDASRWQGRNTGPTDVRNGSLNGNQLSYGRLFYAVF